jgi:hypothetical protein
VKKNCSGPKGDLYARPIPAAYFILASDRFNVLVALPALI